MQLNGNYPKLPSLGAKVFIEGNCFRNGIQTMFAMAGCTGVTEVREADLVVFSGGEDINPALYGQEALRCTHFNAKRDERCDEIFEEARVEGVPMFGICRGMQYLHAKAGGLLYQNVKNHAGGSHDITLYEGVVDDYLPMFTGSTTFAASSLHHQMCIEDTNVCIPLAYCTQEGRGAEYTTVSETWKVESVLYTDKHRDLEAAAYPEICAAAVQGHPELLSPNLGQFVNFSLHICQQLLYEGFAFPLKPKTKSGVIKPSVIIPEIFNTKEEG